MATAAPAVLRLARFASTWLLAAGSLAPAQADGAAAKPAPRSAPRVASPRAAFLAGRFDAACLAYREQIAAGGDQADAARRHLAFVEAVAFGRFEPSMQTLRTLHAADRDFLSGALLARLAALHGQTNTALAQALAALALPAEVHEKVALLECALAWAEPSESATRACQLLYELDPWNAVARSLRFRAAIAADDFAAAEVAWRELHFVDLLDRDLFEAAGAVAPCFAAAATTPEARWRLGHALAKQRRFREAAHCLRDARDAESRDVLARAGRFAQCLQELAQTFRLALGVGLVDDKAKAVFRDSLPRLGAVFGVASTAELYRLLRDDYGLHLLLLTAEPAMVFVEATEILVLDQPPVPTALGGGTVRRVVTGADLFRMAKALAPATGGAGAKDMFRPDWPDTIVLHASDSIGLASEALAVAEGVRQDPAADQPPIADPAADPGRVASAYGVGNQGNRCLQRMRELVAKAVAARVPAPAPGSRAHRDAFVGELARADLLSSTLHELRHVDDHRHPGPDRAGREQRAFLTELELAPPPSRYLRLGIVATGGDPTTSGDPYELANLELLVGFLRTVLGDPSLAPQIDRQRNLQAQIHLLEPDEIATIARRVLAERTK